MTDFYQTMQELHLADKPYWTISTDDKRPIDAQRALSLHFDPKRCNPRLANSKGPVAKHYWGNMAHEPMNESLITLDDIYHEPTAPNRSCALRADIDTEHIILIDIEKEYDKSFIQPYLRQLPIIYGERSRHGGIHLIVPISDDTLQIDKYTDLLNDSNKKICELKNDDTKDGKLYQKHTGIEIFFHDHFLTFTQNQVPVANNNTQEGLRRFLDKLLEIVETTSQLAQTNLFTDDQYEEHNSKVLNIARHAITPYQDNKIKKHIYLTEDDSDLSHRDYNNIFMITRCVLDTAKHFYREQPFTQADAIYDGVDINHDPYDPKIQALVIVYLARTKYMKHQHRDKWDRYYSNHNQNYMEYIVNRAVDYIRSH